MVDLSLVPAGYDRDTLQAVCLMAFPIGRLSCSLKFKKEYTVGLNTFLLHFLDLGPGWVPAVINSTLEADFLRQVQKFPDVADRSYWIGGSTNAGHLQNLGLSQYRTDDGGKILLYIKVS